MKHRILLSLLLVSILGVVGCGPREPEPAQPAPAPAQAAPEAAPPAAEATPEAAPGPAQASTAQAWVTPQIVREPAIKLLDEEGAGKLYQVGEHQVCVVEGTHAAMGFQEGRLLAPRIRHMMLEGYVANSLYGKGYTPEYVNEQGARMEKHMPASYIEEMKGMVDGLRAADVDEVTYDHLRAAAVMAELQHREPGAPAGCSNFAVFGRWTPDGRLLHGRNLDWSVSAGAQEDAVILVRRPANGIATMMPTWAGCIGGVSGMNAKGITIGEMTSSTTDETFDGIPLMVIMRRAIEEASTLDEAIAILQQGPRTLGWNFVIGDGQASDARALEVDAADCEVFAPLDPKESDETGHLALADAVRRTNHPCGQKLLKKLVELEKDKVPAGVDVSDWNVVKGLLKGFDTWQRYDWLGQQIQGKAHGVDVEQALELLANGPVFCEATLHSWVFDPKNKVAYVAIAGSDPALTATRRPFTRVDLAQWFQ